MPLSLFSRLWILHHLLQGDLKNKQVVVEHWAVNVIYLIIHMHSVERETY